MRVEDAVRAVVEPLLPPHELALEQVNVRQIGKRRLVQVTLDLADGPGALGSDLLGDVSREISGALDVADAVPGAYTLEVTTPGAERSLTTPRHYRRAQGRLLRATLVPAAAEALAGGAGAPVPVAPGERTLLARLVAVEDDVAVLRTARGGEVRVPLGDIESASVEVELRRIDEPTDEQTSQGQEED